MGGIEVDVGGGGGVDPKSPIIGGGGGAYGEGVWLLVYCLYCCC